MIDVYAQAFRQADGYDRLRGNPWAWLLTIARTRAIDRVRAETSRARHQGPLDALDELSSLEPDPEAASCATERGRLVHAALASLSHDQRQVIEIAYFSGLTHSEIAARLGQPIGTVKTRIRTGLLRLREVPGSPARRGTRMRHAIPTDALQEQAALYALGALGTDEAREFETHLAEGCATCTGEVRAFRTVAADLGHAVAPAMPRPVVRERLLARVRQGAPAAGGILVRASDPGWRPGPAPGITARLLHRDPATRRSTALVRLAPGAGYPAHAHADTEELYLLSGGAPRGRHPAASRGLLRGGAPESRHVLSVSPMGCTFVVNASEDDRVGDDAPGSAEGILVVHAGDGGWRPGPTEGVSYRVLRKDSARGTHTSLVRMSPGAVIPAHRHQVAEQTYFLEGDGRMAGEVLGPGDYYRMPAGTVHEASTTRSGCTFLMFSARNEVLA